LRVVGIEIGIGIEIEAYKVDPDTDFDDSPIKKNGRRVRITP
jgi:hypothetical protein